MYNENKKWFSQTLLYYEDKTYQTDGKLRVGISTNTSNDLNFNPPAFNISISHNFQKSCNLNIQQAMELFNSIKTATSSNEFNDIEILKRISANIEIFIKFKMDQSNNPVVEIILRSNSSDFTKIIITSNVFSTVVHRLKNFVNNYDNLCYQLLMKSIDGEDRQIIRQIPGLIRGISSQIITTEIPDGGVNKSEPVKKAPAEQTIEDLDKFLGVNLENVTIPEIENKQIIEEKKSIYEVNSNFATKVLQNKLINLENLLTTMDSSKSPVMDLNNEMTKLVEKNITFLPNISDDELKSTVYISKLLCSLITQSHIKSGSPIPTSTPILQYKSKTIDEDHLELSYDLLTFIAYIRAVRNKLNGKNNDFIVNKTRFYLQLRCYMDVFCFSFLEKADKTRLRSIISNRFKYYDSIGMFDYYKELLNNNNCTEVKEYDVDIFVTEAAEKVIGKTMYIIEQHNKLIQSNSFKLPTSNKFNLEQIINEFIPLEIAEKMGEDISNKEASVEVKNLFMGKKDIPKVNENKKEKTSNISRFVTHYRNEIPDQYREDFLLWIKGVEDKNFIIKDCDYPLAEFGNNIIKGLYLWQPVDDEKLSNNYKYFWSKFEDCLLDKNYILALDEKDEKMKTDEEEWSDVFNDIAFE